MDVKAEHFERQVQRLEQERDQMEKKWEVRRQLMMPTSLALISIPRRVGIRSEVPPEQGGARRPDGGCIPYGL